MYSDWYNLNNYNPAQGATSGFDAWFSQFPAATQGLVAGFVVMACLFGIALLVLQIIGMARAFKKAKQPTWAAIVPFYNLFIMIKISGLELWWFAIAALISVSWGFFGWVALAFWGFINYKIAKSYGKGTAFTIGLTLLSPIFWMMLGYSSEIKYKGPAGPYKIKYPETPKKSA